MCNVSYESILLYHDYMSRSEDLFRNISFVWYRESISGITIGYQNLNQEEKLGIIVLWRSVGNNEAKPLMTKKDPGPWFYSQSLALKIEQVENESEKN